MARIGFKKTWAAGAFNTSAVQDLFGHIKTYVVNAGFNVLINNSDAIDFIRSGSPAGTTDDDTPHWALKSETGQTYGIIRAYSVYGQNYADQTGRTGNTIIVNSDFLGSSPPQITFWFAADGVAGWWWLSSASPDTTMPSGIDRRFLAIGATSRRYPSDMYQGLHARYGVCGDGGAYFPYAKKHDGSVLQNTATQAWTPFGITGWGFIGKRHSGSPLPKMAVPVFPTPFYNTSACILGEFNEILAITDGYAQEEIVIPGWIAMKGDGQIQSDFALPAPASFDVLP